LVVGGRQGREGGTQRRVGGQDPLIAVAVLARWWDQSPLLQSAAEGTGRFNGAGYVEFLKQLLARFDAPIILIEDGAPYHRSHEVKHFQAEHAQRLTIEPLPAFSPEYNPIEKLWRNTKKEATHLKYFKTFDELRASVRRVFHQYLDDATQVIRVMKKLRTTAGIA
jgi:transposase